MLRRRSAGPAPQATPKGGSSQYAGREDPADPDARAVLAGTKRMLKWTVSASHKGSHAA